MHAVAKVISTGDENDPQDGKIRIRFESVSKRLQRVNVDILHKRPESFSLQENITTPDNGEMGCFLLDEIDRLKTLDNSPAFKKLCYELGGFVQSLPELLHHQKKVVKILVQYINNVPANTIGSGLSLISVLGRDMKEELNPHFHALYGALVNVTAAVSMSGGFVMNDQTPNPELTGKLFETMSYLLRANLSNLVEKPDELSAYYGALLGSPTEFVRMFAAKSLTIVFRKLGNTVFKQHLKKLFKVVAGSVKAALNDNIDLLVLDEYQQIDSASYSSGLRRSKWLLHGFSQLLFVTLKGIRGQIHSKALKRVQLLHELMLSQLAADKEKSKSAADFVPNFFLIKTYAAIINRVTNALHRHLYYENQMEMLGTNLGYLEQLDTITRTVQSSADAENNADYVNLLVFIALQMVKAILNAAHGRAFKNEQVKEKICPVVTKRILQLSTFILTEEATILDDNFALFRQVLMQVFKLYCHNAPFCTKIATVFEQLFDAKSKHVAESLQDITAELMGNIPANVIAHFVLPSVFNGLVGIKKTLSVTQWNQVTSATLFQLKDFRENTDAVFNLSSVAVNDADEESEEEPEDEDDNEDSFSFKVADPKKQRASNFKRKQKLQRQRMQSSAAEYKLTEKHLVKHSALSQLFKESLQQLLTLYGSSKVKKSHKGLQDKSMEEQYNEVVLFRLLMWFLKCTKSLVVAGSDTESSLRSTMLEMYQQTIDILPAITVKITAPSSSSAVTSTEVASKKKTANKASSTTTEVTAAVQRSTENDSLLLWIANYYEFFATIAANQLEEKALQKTYIASIKALVKALIASPKSLALTYALSNMLTIFQSSVSSTPKNFLGDLLDMDTSEQLISSAGVALANGSSWLRLTWLRVLQFLPPPEDHHVKQAASSGDPMDSDEEFGMNVQGRHTLPMFDVCLDIACIPISLHSEREITRRLEMLEVMARANTQLEKHYLTMLSGFCLGMFQVKFKPLWQYVIQILETIVQQSSGEEALWPLLSQCLQVLQQPPVVAAQTEDASSSDDIAQPTVTLSSTMFQQMLNYDDGHNTISTSIAQSCLFWFQVGVESRALAITPDSRTDQDTVCVTVFEFLKKASTITLKRSKVIVPSFIDFLQDQYYAVFVDEPEVVPLSKLGFLKLNSTGAAGRKATHATFSVKSLKARFTAYLSVFAAVPSPKQLYKHNLLFALYHEIVCKPDVAVSKLAFDCILTYKPSYLMPYREHVKQFFDDKKLRNELLTFHAGVKMDEDDEDAYLQQEEDSVVKEEYKPDLCPLLIRILYGRLISKPSMKRGEKDQNIARRSAVLSFVAKMDHVYLRHLLFLMIRGVLPNYVHDISGGRDVVIADESKAVQEYLVNGYDLVLQHVNKLTTADLQSTTWERLQGFLFLLQPVISLLGFGLTSYITTLDKLLVMALGHAHEQRDVLLQQIRDLQVADADQEDEVVEDNEAGDDDDEAQHAHHHDGHDDQVGKQVKIARLAANVRTLCMMRYAELVEMFHAVYNFQTNSKVFFHSVQPLLEALSSAVTSSHKAPAILLVIQQFASFKETVGIVAKFGFMIQHVIECLSISTMNFEVAKVIYIIMERLLDFEGGVCMHPFAEMIVSMFTRRFQGKDIDEDGNSLSTELKLSDVVVNNYIGGAKYELQLLCRITQEVFSLTHVKISSLSSSNLATIVLGLLRAYTNSRKTSVSEDWVINVLKIYKSLLWRIPDISSHVSFVSRLFGPTAIPSSLFNVQVVRKQLIDVYAEMSKHKSVEKSLSASLDCLQAITTADGGMLGSRDYDTFIPTLQALSDPERIFTKSTSEASWSAILGPLSYQRREVKARSVSSHLALCSAVVFELIRCMYDGEIGVRASAVTALKCLIASALTWDEKEPQKDWLSILVSIVIPAVRKGIQSSSDMVKNCFLAVFAHLVRESSKKNIQHEAFHVDMAGLLNDDPEQDFFENISHIQMHRRARAFMKLKAALIAKAQRESMTTSDEELAEAMANTQPLELSGSTFVHVLLPILFHYLCSEEFNKKLHHNLLQDVSALVGAICLHLTWNQYLSTFRKVTKLLDRCKEEKERNLQATLCAVLDGFHFDISHDLHATKAPVADEDADAEDDVEAEEEVGKADEENKENPADNNALVASVTTNKKTIASVVISYILSTVKAFLIKKVKDHKGEPTETVQTNIALALTNLIKRLEPPTVPKEVRAHLFTNLVISIVTTLKSRDTSIRDAARGCLSKMIMILGLGTLKSVVYELQSILKEGYQRHVASYTLRSLLSTILENYSPDVNAASFQLEDLVRLQESKSFEPSIPDFDASIPLIMTAVLQDISEEMKQDREVEGALRTNAIREMKGSKFNEILEITARCLLFRPTYALVATANPADVSSIHAVSTPLLHALHHFHEQNYNGDTSSEHFQTLSGRVAEALQRVALGLAKNPSVKDKELLLYLHATLQPFVITMLSDYRKYKQAIGKVVSQSEPVKKKKKQTSAIDSSNASVGGNNNNRLDAILEEQESDFEIDLPSYLRGEESDEEERFETAGKRKLENENNIRKYRSAQWLPREWRALPTSTMKSSGGSSQDKTSSERRAILEERDKASKALYKVQDGASAPKLTGRNRFDRLKTDKNTLVGVDKSTLVAIKYCLTLMYSSLKKGVFDSNSEEIQSMLVPFVPLLRSFLYIPGASEVVTLAVKCIGSLLQWGLKIDKHMFQHLANRILLLMLQSGKAMVTTDNELCQACFVTLVQFFKRYNEQQQAYDKQQQDIQAQTKSFTKEELLEKPIFPLDEMKVRVLVEMLTASIMEVTSSYQHPAFQLIKEVINSRVIIAEIYDLVKSLSEQIVLSHRKGIRDMASSIIVHFLLIYPIGKQRMESHIQQLLNNTQYNYEEGRQSAISTVKLLVRSFPVPVLEEYAVLIFLSMTLKLSNEKSPLCRTEVVEVLMSLTKRLYYGGSTNVVAKGLPATNSRDIINQYLEYGMKWILSLVQFNESQPTLKLTDQMLSLTKIGAQVMSILFKGQPDIYSSNNANAGIIRDVIKVVCQSISILLKHSRVGGDDVDEDALARTDNSSHVSNGYWNSVYHLLSLMETLYQHVGGATDYALTHFMAIQQAEGSKKKGSKNVAAAISTAGEEFNFLNTLVHELLLYPHVWVRAVALRILSSYCKRRPVKFVHAQPMENSFKLSPYFGSSDPKQCYELLIQPNMLYHMARKIALVLNQPILPAHLEDVAVQNMVYVIRLMIAHPTLDTFADNNTEDDEELAEGENGMEEMEQIHEEGDEEAKAMEVAKPVQQHASSTSYEKMAKANRKAAKLQQLEEAEEAEEVDSGDEEEDLGDAVEDADEENEEDAEEEHEISDSAPVIHKGLHWSIHRLRAIGADIRGNRRKHILRVLAQLLLPQDEELSETYFKMVLESLKPYMQQVLEVPVRVMLAQPSVSGKKNDAQAFLEEDQELLKLKEYSADLLQALELRLGAVEFMGLFGVVQRKVEKIKSDKKRRMKGEAVSNPTLYAQKKILKNQHKKISKKRKTLKHMAIKGLKRQRREPQQQIE